MSLPNTSSSKPSTWAVFADEEGNEFGVLVFGALTYHEVIAEAERHVQEFIDLGAWEPIGKPAFHLMQEDWA